VIFKIPRQPEDTPPDIIRFEWLWLMSMAAGALVTIFLYDYAVISVGPYRAAAFNILLFATSAVLMIYASRRRLNFARWMLVVPFNMIIVAYDLSHFVELVQRSPLIYVALIRLTLMAVATYYLFTPQSRAWFAGRAITPELVEPSDSDADLA
jgi:hypothetical protein